MAQPIQNNIATVTPTNGDHKDLKAKSSHSSSSDHFMYLAMLAIIEGIGEAESMGGSIANMSTTLYNTLVKNGTDKLTEMQKELEAMNGLEENWKGFAGYMTWSNSLSNYKEIVKEGPGHTQKSEEAYMIAVIEVKKMSGHAPAPFNTYSPAQIKDMKSLYNQYAGNLSGFRKGINLFAQGLSTQNTVIQNNKLLPDSDQQQIKALVGDQSAFAAQLSSFLKVMKSQWTNS